MDSIDTTSVVGGLFMLVFSAISIGISGYQHETNDGTGHSLSYCKQNPIQWLTPFRVRTPNESHDTYCGYNNASTGYRLAIAGFTFLYSFIFIFTRKMLSHFTFWVVNMLLIWWACAVAVDAMAVHTGFEICKYSFQGGGTKCEMAIYGTSIAFDMMMVLILFALVGAQVMEMVAAAGQAPVPTQPPANEGAVEVNKV